MAESGNKWELVAPHTVIAKTKSQVIKLQYDWMIENLSLKSKKTSEYLESSTFSHEGDATRKWQLLIFPNGEYHHCSQYLGLHLQLTESLYHTKVKCNVTLLNSNQKVVAKPNLFSCPNSGVIRPGQRIGSPTAILIRDLLQSLPDDQLHVKCEIVYEVDETTIASCTYSSEKLQFSSSNSGNLVDHFKLLFNSKTFADIVIDVKGQKFEAHKVVLASRSPVFLAMFQNDLMEKKTNTVKIEDIEPVVFEEVLRFIYTDEVNKMEDMAPNLLAVADKYMLDLLKARCEEFLASYITVETCGKLLVLAHLHSALELKKKILDFVHSRSIDIIEALDWQELWISAQPQLLRNIAYALETTAATMQTSNK